MPIYWTAFIIAFCAATSVAQQNDWPQWHGPDRSNVSKETGLLKSWPAGGPLRLWSISGLGNGYGTVAIKADRIYVQGTQRGKSVVYSLNRANGAPVWICPLGDALSQERGGGPRGTPTVDGDAVYALTEAGDLACIRSQDGSAGYVEKGRFRIEDRGWPSWAHPVVCGGKLYIRNQESLTVYNIAAGQQ
jgi:hypothetical protein